MSCLKEECLHDGYCLDVISCINMTIINTNNKRALRFIFAYIQYFCTSTILAY